jgi:hypothetical protein
VHEFEGFHGSALSAQGGPPRRRLAEASHPCNLVMMSSGAQVAIQEQREEGSASVPRLQVSDLQRPVRTHFP